MSDSVRPQRWQPTRLPRPWDSPGKNTGVGCHFLLQCMKEKSESEVAQSCPTLRDPMDCSPPGSSVHGFSRQEDWSGVPSPSPSDPLAWFKFASVGILSVASNKATSNWHETFSSNGKKSRRVGLTLKWNCWVSVVHACQVTSVVSDSVTL